MGAGGKNALRVGFDSSTRLVFYGTKASFDCGLLAYRVLDSSVSETYGEQEGFT